ncbi:hypothetical protein [Eubacterium callanderi]|uniref:hypothetical protein n=1 Tax=Eubacterium callanderi TaxID=53442 RepID=UPI00206B497A|nr:MAG TPA: hypothetical protein [Caudoviricetes sp.]
MYKFDDSETETYFYEMARMYGIQHVNLSDDRILTMDDVDNIVHDVKAVQALVDERRR